MSREFEIKIPNEIVEAALAEGQDVSSLICLPSSLLLEGFGAVKDEKSGTMIVEWVFWVGEVEPL